MPKYRWRGITQVGIKTKGTLFSTSPTELKKTLLTQQIALLSYKETNKFYQNIKLSPKFNPKTFFHNLAITLSSGIPLVQALTLTNTYTKSNIISSLICNINQGECLSEAMRTHTIFSPLMIEIVRAGEKSDNLHTSLSYLVENLHQRDTFVKKLRNAALMPAITTLFALTVTIAIIAFVAPQIEPILSSMHGPKPSGLLFTLTNLYHTQGNTIAITMIIILTTLLAIIRITRKYKTEWATQLTLHIPVVKKMITWNNLIHFSRTLTLLLKTGTPLKAALNIAKNACPNKHIKSIITTAAKRVEQGKPLGTSLRNPIIPDSFITSITLGEQANRLETMLDNTSQIMETALMARIHLITTLFQPILLVCVGGFIAFLLLSLYMPIFDLATPTNTL